MSISIEKNQQVLGNGVHEDWRPFLGKRCSRADGVMRKVSGWLGEVKNKSKLRTFREAYVQQ